MENVEIKHLHILNRHSNYLPMFHGDLNLLFFHSFSAFSFLMEESPWQIMTKILWTHLASYFLFLFGYECLQCSLFSSVKWWHPPQSTLGSRILCVASSSGLPHSPLPYYPFCTWSKLNKVPSGKRRKPSLSQGRSDFHALQRTTNQWSAGYLWGESLRCQQSK